MSIVAHLVFPLSQIINQQKLAVTAAIDCLADLSNGILVVSVCGAHLPKWPVVIRVKSEAKRDLETKTVRTSSETATVCLLRHKMMKKKKKQKKLDS